MGPVMKSTAQAIVAGLCFSAVPAAAEFAVSTLYFECGDDCRAFRDGLAEADARELANIPGQVTETLAVIEDQPIPQKAAAGAAKMIAKGPFDGRFDRVKPGTRSCTVYWFGFLDDAGRRVGTHRCRVSAKGGGLTVEKLTGDGLSAPVRPYAGSIRAFAGRTFLPDHPERAYDAGKPANAGNGNFGNKVGLALADGGRLYLVSIDERGFTEPDRTFFEVLVVE